MNRVCRFLNAKGGAGFFVLSLALAFFVFLNFSILGCSSSGCSGTTGSSEATATAPAISSAIETDFTAVSPGDTVVLIIKGEWQGEGNGDFVWVPPDGVTDFVFPDEQPEPGGPPYVFKNLGMGGTSVQFQVPQDFQGNKIDNTLTVIHGDNRITSVASQGIYHSGLSSARSQRSRKVVEMKASLAPSDPRAVWQVTHYRHVDAELDQQRCRDIVAQLKSPNTFTVWQVPVADEIVSGQSYTLPIVHTATYSPRFMLLTAVQNIEMPLEIRQQATIWANSHLPSEPGRLWVALGADPDATVDDCPVMNLTGFNMLTQFRADLSERPQGCVNCVLESYTCYKTGEGSLLETAGIAGILAASQAGIAVDDFTCIGPSDTNLLRDPDWQVEDDTNTLVKKPGDAIQIQYWVYNFEAAPLQLALAPASTLAGANWSIHPGLPGNLWTPDPDHVVGSTISVPAMSGGVPGEYHLHIMGSVPTNAALDQYRYTLTLSNPAANPPSLTGDTVLVVTADGDLPGAVDLQAGVGLLGRAASGYVEPGKNLTYYLTIENTGPQPLTNLVLTDALPENTSFVSCGGGDSCANSSGTITWNLAALGAGHSHVMSLVVNVDPGALAGENITNGTYSVQTGESVSATGEAIVTPVIILRKIYLPNVSRR